MKVRTLISVIILLLATFVLFAGKKISIDETYGRYGNIQ
jgi:hypothetical protein